MPPEVQQRCFEPFFTTKAAGQGSGLGLSQVHGFVRQSGGHVAIDSAPGRGTRVTLYLPTAAGEAEERPEEEAAPGADAPLVPANVLVVEDDEHVRTATCAALEEIGCRVLAAGDAREALAILELDDAIDLLFSDVVMPNGPNGVQLARAARSGRPDLKVLLTSGYAAVVEQHEGEFDVLAKPYRRAELATRIRSALAGGPAAALR
jgi:CheY-like chemotaxis protein